MGMGPSDPSLSMGMNSGMNMGGPDIDMGVGGGMPTEEPNPYAADFDAGVEADEDTDPRTFIQQLAGKLSQSLRKYNEGQPQPDGDLNKYVAGMVIAQAVKGLAPEDVTEIMNKIKDDSAQGQQPDGMGNAMAPTPDASMTDGQTGGMTPPDGGMAGGQPLAERFAKEIASQLDDIKTRAPKGSPYEPKTFRK